MRIAILNTGGERYIVRMTPDGDIYSQTNLINITMEKRMKAVAKLFETSEDRAMSIVRSSWESFMNDTNVVRIGANLLSHPTLTEYMQIQHVFVTYGSAYNKKTEEFTTNAQ